MASASYKDWLTKDRLKLLEGWSRRGLSQEQIAQNIGCATSTLKVWRKKHQAISDAIKKGAEVANIELENAIFKSAIGYDVEEVETSEEMHGNVLVTKTRVKTRHIPPNVAAQIFLLKNRMPKFYRENPEQEQDATSQVVIIDDIS